MSNGNEIEARMDGQMIHAEIVDPQRKIKELEDEIGFWRGRTSQPQEQSQQPLAKILSNPGSIQQMFNLDETQASNVASLLTGAGAGLTRKYLTRALGPEIAGAIGGFLGGYLSHRLVGK